ncbi:uncharacterized protein LOC143292031 [Babylonia areolata]|uniref:uncharacterized protein LOC143292031 n=1 Tax=Babylonia areolata TaxID=304850 RepID=UPI003FCF82A8
MEGLGLKFVFGRPLKGWLRQHMGMMRGWQRRYFVLDSGRLYCLTGQDDVLAIKTFTLKDCELKELSKSSDSSFELTSGNGDSVVLRAANEEERKEWVKALRYTIYGDTGGGVFGVPLAVLMEAESKEGRKIPYIVEACVNHLDLNARETEGIFRSPGRTGLVKELRGKFDAGYRPVLDSVDVHTVGSLLKAYLRDLPESLVPPSFYQKAMNFSLRYSDASSDEAQMKELNGLSKLLKELPSYNYATLAYICQFLHGLAASSEKTLMNSHNFSLVFGPNLIRHMDDNPELMMVTTDLTQHLAYMLIHHCHSIFAPVPDEEPTQIEAVGDSSVMRRKKVAQDSVPTADLLQISSPLDSQTHTSKSMNRTTALSDLMGVDFNTQQDEVFVGQSSASSTILTDQFEACSLGSSDKREGSASSETCGGTGCVETGPATGQGVGSKPVPPKRTKSRTLKRNQHLSADSLPLNTDASSQQLTGSGRASAIFYTDLPIAENDRATKSATKDNLFETDKDTGVETTDKQIQEEQSTRSFLPDNRDKSKEGKDNEDSLFQVGGYNDLATNAAVEETGALGVDTAEVGPSRTLLETEVLALKTELVSAKSQYDYQVSSLKSELNRVRSVFEEKISSMEKQHAIQVKDLTARLAVERKSRAEAVDQTVSLQAELYKYKLQYGELQDSK